MQLLPEEQEFIRRAFRVEHKPIRQIERETGHCRQAIRKAISSPLPFPGTSSPFRSVSIFGSFQARVEALLAQNDLLPRRQRYTRFDLLTLDESGFIHVDKAEGRFSNSSAICMNTFLCSLSVIFREVRRKAMNNDPYETPNNPPPYVTREGDRTRNPGPYANPNKQPLMVPKRFGFGYSFNWNNPRAIYMLLALIGVPILLILVVVLLTVLLVHH